MKAFRVLTLTACFLVLLGPWAGAAELTPHSILQLADEARGNLEGVEWEVWLSSIENGRKSEMTYNVQARGFDVLGTALAPPNDKGNKVLLLSGNMWFYKPGLSKPVPIAQRQKLLGNAAYGDIASTNYANDYEPKLLADETVGDELCYVFDLKATTNKVTYDRIMYWVSRERLVGVKADYYTVSGKKFKTATMEHDASVVVRGQQRPFISRMIIRDVLVGANETSLSFKNAEIKRIPDYVFNLNLLTK